MFVCILMFFALFLIGFGFVFVMGLKRFGQKTNNCIFVASLSPIFVLFCMCISILD